MFHRQVVVFEPRAHPIGVLQSFGEFPAGSGAGSAIGAGEGIQQLIDIGLQKSRLSTHRIHQRQHQPLCLAEQSRQKVPRRYLGIALLPGQFLGVGDSLAAAGGESFEDLRH